MHPGSRSPHDVAGEGDTASARDVRRQLAPTNGVESQSTGLHDCGRAHPELVGVMRVTLQTIADRLGVSRMTVSNAFSHPDQLSTELRTRILATAEELGYVGPDPVGRALARGSTGAVGVLLTDVLTEAFTDEVATGFLAAIVDELAPTGLALTLLTASDRGDVVPARDLALDGALVYSCRVDSAARAWLIRRRLPLVYVDQDPAPGVPTVNVDDRGGARAAAEHLVKLGHRRIGLLNRTLDGSAGLVADPRATTQGHPQRERLRGWLDALQPESITPIVVHVPDNSDEAVREAARTLLLSADRPTAVLCFSDVLAFGVVAVASELGLSVPDDLSVVGFDDIQAAGRRAPRLTTVHQDVGAKGRAAAHALVSAIERARSGTKTRARHIVLPTELIVRDSTAVPGAL
jgi:DNA-binding LacI/PurR family transcriptional regulator